MLLGSVVDISLGFQWAWTSQDCSGIFQDGTSQDCSGILQDGNSHGFYGILDVCGIHTLLYAHGMVLTALDIRVCICSILGIHPRSELADNKKELLAEEDSCFFDQNSAHNFCRIHYSFGVFCQRISTPLL